MFSNRQLATFAFIASACFLVSSCTGVSNPNRNAKIPAGGGKQPVPAQSQMEPNPVETITPVPPDSVQGYGQSGGIFPQIQAPISSSHLQNSGTSIVNCSPIIMGENYNIKNDILVNVISMAKAHPIKVFPQEIKADDIISVEVNGYPNNFYVAESLISFIQTGQQKMRIVGCASMGMAVVGVQVNDTWHFADQYYAVPDTSNTRFDPEASLSCALKSNDMFTKIWGIVDVNPMNSSVQGANISAHHVAQIGNETATQNSEIWVPEQIVDDFYANKNKQVYVRYISCDLGKNIFAVGIMDAAGTNIDFLEGYGSR